VHEDAGEEPCRRSRSCPYSQLTTHNNRSKPRDRRLAILDIMPGNDAANGLDLDGGGRIGACCSSSRAGISRHWSDFNPTARDGAKCWVFWRADYGNIRSKDGSKTTRNNNEAEDDNERWVCAIGSDAKAQLQSIEG